MKTLTDKAKELYLRIQDIAPLNTLDLLISELGGEDEVAEVSAEENVQEKIAHLTKKFISTS